MVIDLHANLNVLLKYVDIYRKYLPVSSLSVQQKMQYKYNDKLLESSFDCDAQKQWDLTPQCNISLAESRDRAVGALIGLAVGDAVGTTLEFLPRDKAHVKDMIGGGPFRLRAGEWTDDTSMALCLAETLLEKGDADTICFRNKLLEWHRHGYNSSNGICFDIGNTTRFALEQYLTVGPGWIGNTAPETAGNASIIRQAPVSIFLENH
jgi:hypothetical protein